MFEQIKYGVLLSMVPILSHAQSLGESAEGLYEGPVSVLALMMVWLCYVVGAAFCIGAVMQLRIHFQNPKQVPLLTPVVMVVAGVTLIFLPYFSQMGSNTASPLVNNPKEAYRPPVPYVTRKHSHDGYVVDPNNNGGGHWADDPRYNQ